jgi:hypothetical protein
MMLANGVCSLVDASVNTKIAFTTQRFRMGYLDLQVHTWTLHLYIANGPFSTDLDYIDSCVLGTTSQKELSYRTIS